MRLGVWISAKGNVDGVEVLGGNPILGESAAIAVKQRIYAAGRTRSGAEVSIPFDNQRDQPENSSWKVAKDMEDRQKL